MAPAISVPLASSKTRNGPFWSHFFGRNEPYDMFWEPNSKNGAPISVCAAFWGRKKHECVKLRITCQNTHCIDPKCMLFQACLLDKNIAFCQRKMHISNTHPCFPLIFRQCFSCICGTFKKNMALGTHFRFFGRVKMGSTAIRGTSEGPFREGTCCLCL